jgi:hypothetical protein
LSPNGPTGPFALDDWCGPRSGQRKRKPREHHQLGVQPNPLKAGALVAFLDPDSHDGVAPYSQSFGNRDRTVNADQRSGFAQGLDGDGFIAADADFVFVT